MGHVRAALGGARDAGQPHHLRMAHDALDRGRCRLQAEQSCRGIAHALHDVRKPEHRLFPGQALRQRFQHGGEIAHLLLGDDFRLAHQLRDQHFALTEAQGLLAPAPVPHLRVVVGRLARSGDLVRRRRPRRIAFDLEAHVIGGALNRRTPLRPVRREVFRHACDPGELPVPAVLLQGETEALLKVPGEGIAVDRARRFHPTIDRVLMERPPLAVLVRPGGIEDHAVGVKLRVVVPAGAVLEHRRHEIRRQNLNLPAAVADAGPGTVPEHRLFQRHPRGIVVGLLDLTAQLGIGDGPQGRHALVGREGHVEAWRALPAAGVPGEPARAVRREAVIEAVEVAGIRLAAVLQAEQAVGVEPHPVWFLARRVVLVGMAERALAP